MLILFVLLALQILPAKWVNPGCYVLIRAIWRYCLCRLAASSNILICSAHSLAQWFPVQSVRWWFSGGELEFTTGAR